MPYSYRAAKHLLITPYVLRVDWQMNNKKRTLLMSSDADRFSLSQLLWIVLGASKAIARDTLLFIKSFIILLQ